MSMLGGCHFLSAPGDRLPLRLFLVPAAVLGLAISGHAQPTVARITLLTKQGGRLDWSRHGDRIAFDRIGESGFFEIYSMRPDGSEQRCLTCDQPAAPRRHKGNPAYHPSGDWIAFQAERDDLGAGAASPRAMGRFGGRRRAGGGAGQRRADFFGTPGRGFLNDLWIMDARGERYWKVESTDARVGGILHPHFSPSGDKLTWAERIGAGDAVSEVGRGGWGEWDVRVADFRVADGVPRLSHIRKVQPGAARRLFETHGFTPDGRKVLFTAMPERGSNKLGFDLYLYDLGTQELKNLTDSPNEWDEHGQISPDGTKILWMSSRGYPLSARAAEVKTDYWVMNLDGSSKKQLTFFNDPKSSQYIQGGVTAGDCSWSPEGTRLAAYLIEDATQNRGRIVMIDLDWGESGRR